MNDLPDNLYAVTTSNGVVCAGCARKRYAKTPVPDECTPVLLSDDWRSQVAGICEDCKTFVDPEETF